MTATLEHSEDQQVARSGPGGELTGLRRLLRLAARRDRVVLPVWLGALLVLLIASVASIIGLYGSDAERIRYATVAATNAVARAIDGPMSGTSLGAITMTEVFGIMALLTAIMAAQAVVRHTRLEEETGRAELVGSAVVGRQARLVAGLIVSGAASVAIGAMTAVTLLVAGLPGAGSVVAGAAVAGVGLTFAGVAAVAAQLAHTARGAGGLSIAAIGAAFLLRAVGDAMGSVADSGVEVVSAWPSWLSPIGWGQQARPFGGDHAWVLGLYAVAVVVFVALAFWLTRHRDVGSGMLPVRPGPARGSRWLRSPIGLALRLQRGSLIAWAVGLGIVAAALGAISDEVEGLLETSDELVELIGAVGAGDVLLDLYVAFTLALLGLAAAAYLVQAVLRVRAEEVAGRAEPVLSTAVGRMRFVAAHLWCAVIGVTAILVLVGVVGGTTGGLATGVWGARFGSWVLASVTQLPAVLVVGAVAVAAIGLVPRWSVAIAWSGLVLALVVGQFGGLFGLPQAVLNLSPFTHVAAVPAEDLRILPLVVLTVCAVVIAAVGLVGWRRRDIDG